MEFGKLVAFSETLHKLADSHQDLFESELKQFKRSHAIQSPQQLEQTFQAVQEQNRLMNIGIVGRVKAGKSSLLNALIFDGEPILPKAATPMTAALTTITWGETFHAKVEFFSETDFNIIKNKANHYQTRLKDLTQESFEELSKRRQTQLPPGTPINTEELTSLATRQAQKKLQSEVDLVVADDQYQRMLETGLELSALHSHSEIKASSPTELAERLQSYVGAEGKFMPFTKTVHVFMPLEALRDIRVIDTPGMNDPVQSREARTVQLLKTCDVVFIVSPAGQFLNEQDLELMGRITQKDGIQELVLIASQVDLQLYGSEKRARLGDALHSIREQLSARAQHTLTALRKNNPEVGDVFDELINSVRSNLLHSSGLCHSLNRRFGKSSHWDSNEKKTWENLTSEYPDYFSDDNQELSLRSLDSLANIAAIKQILAQVRDRKAAIIQDKLASLANNTSKSLFDFKQQLIQLGRNQISQIKSANIGELKKQLAVLDSKRRELKHELDFSFKVTMQEYRQCLRKEMRDELSKLLKDSKSTVQDSEGFTSATTYSDNDGLFNWFARKLWGGGRTENTAKVPTIISSQVVAALTDFINDIQYELDLKATQSRNLLDDKLSKTLTPKVRAALGDDANAQMIRNAIDSVINAIPDESFNLGVTLPEVLSSRGTLKNSEATEFKEAVDDFINTLSSKVKGQIQNFVDNVERSVSVTISDSFVAEIEAEIKRFMLQIEYSEQTIDRLERLVRHTEEATLL